MKILITIAHYCSSEDNPKYGSVRADSTPRVNALSASIFNILALFSTPQYIIEHYSRSATMANKEFYHNIDIAVCTTGGNHILDKLTIPSEFYAHHERNIENPRYLGFECQKILRDNLGKYDYYCFMEDDLIISDPFFFEKIHWFSKQTGDLNLLQPNRYELARHKSTFKSYIDGDIREDLTAQYQNIREYPEVSADVFDKKIYFKRPLNPHSGCYFLNSKQMGYWANQPYFLDMDASFITPLESAATLGIMKTFHVYKPGKQNLNFLEIQHYGNGFISQIK